LTAFHRPHPSRHAEREGLAFLPPAVIPVAAHGLQQIEGTDNIRVDEIARTVDGAVDMTYGREIDDRTRLVNQQQMAHQFPIGDVAITYP